MERCGFFDAELVGEEYDRTYLAEMFAAYFASFIGNGIFGGKSNELQIVAMESPSMQVEALSGQAWINGYWYENIDELYLPVDVADGVLDRIDSVVLRLGFAERNMWIEVKKGTPSNNPLAPELVRNADYYELQLATIYIKAGALNIKQADITDTRLDSAVCGLVVNLVQTLDTSEYGVQLDSYIRTYAAEYAAWIEQLELNSTAEINDLIARLEEIASANDLSALIVRVEHVESQAIESEEYPGCYYRIVNGEIEWVNPPTQPGIEYRLTERFENKPVYQSEIYVASLPNNSLMTTTLNFSPDRIISFEGTAYLDSSYSFTHPFPVYTENAISPSAVIQEINRDSSGRARLVIRTVGNMTAYKANVTIKYVKS